MKHSAFSEINEGVVSLYYQDQKFKTCFGFRVLALDASKIILPTSVEIKNEFGSRKIRNQKPKDLGDYASATFAVCYDVLNNVAIRSVLDRGNTHEINLADEMLKVVNTNDLLICDRAYLSYKFLSSLTKRKIAYVIRCPRSSFNEVNAMFEEKSPSSVEVTICAQRKIKQENSGITLQSGTAIW